MWVVQDGTAIIRKYDFPEINFNTHFVHANHFVLFVAEICVFPLVLTTFKMLLRTLQLGSGSLELYQQPERCGFSCLKCFYFFASSLIFQLSGVNLEYSTSL